MPYAKFNYSTSKLQFNQTTGKLQMVGSPCNYCPEGTTPYAIQADFTGIIPWAYDTCGVGTGTTVWKINEFEPVPLDFSTVLTPGNINCTTDCGFKTTDELDWVAGETYACGLSSLVNRNVGSVRAYAVAGCTGFLGIALLNKIGVHIHRTPSGFWLAVSLNLSPPLAGCGSFNIFYYTAAYSGAECFPYGVELNNQCHIHAPEECLVGNGSVILTKLE
jgi:hypothetical protein